MADRPILFGAAMVRAWPKIATAYETGSMQPLLPGPRGDQ